MAQGMTMCIMDDNAEQLLNETIKYNKQFQFVAYPNRTQQYFWRSGNMGAFVYTLYYLPACIVHRCKNNS